MMPLRPLLKNKILLQKHFNISEESINKWPFWLFEETIKIVNEINEEEENRRKSEEESQQKSMPNFNPSNYMKDLPNIANGLKG